MEHTGPINALAITPDGTEIVSAGDDGTRIWSRSTGNQLRHLTGHTTPVQALAIAPDGTQIATASSGGTVRIWERFTGKQLFELAGHDESVTAIAITPDGRQLVSGGTDGRLVFWSVTTGGELSEFSLERATPVRAIAITPDGAHMVVSTDVQMLIRSITGPSELRGTPTSSDPIQAIAVTPDSKEVVYGCADGTIRRWDVERGELLTKAIVHLNAVNAITISPDGAYIIAATDRGQIHVSNRITGGSIRTLLTPNHNWISAIAATPDGETIVAGGHDGVLWTWPMQSPPDEPALGVHSSNITAMAITPDGRELITAAGTELHIWDSATRQQVREISTDHEEAIRAIAVSPDGDHIFAGAGGELRTFHRTTGRSGNQRWLEHPGNIVAIAVMLDETIIIASSNLNIYTWGPAAGAQGPSTVIGYDPDQPLVITADGDRVIGCELDSNVVRLWDRVTGELVGEPLDHVGLITGFAATPDGRHVVSASSTGHPQVHVWDIDTRVPVRAPDVVDSGPLENLVIAPDGTQLFASTGRSIVVIDLPGDDRPATPAEWLAGVVSDAESAEDLLGITQDVRMIAAVVGALSTRPPLSLALLGNWGAGKSSFMRQVRHRVDDLARQSRGGSSAFAANVRQVTFNAWHYSDDHVWVGLVEHLFRDLAEPENDEVTTEEINDLQVRLSAKRAEQERLSEDLRAVDRVDRRGWLAPFRSALVGRAVVRGAWRELRSGGWRILLVLGLIAAGVATVVFGGAVLQWLGGAVAVLAAVVGPVAVAWRRLGEYTEKARRQLLSRKSTVDGEIQEAEEELTKRDPARRLKSLLKEISTAERYESYRGLTGRIHGDLRRLSHDLTSTLSRYKGAGKPPVQRIVLYVDDLDRCAPRRVVDVLQAVNLLLTMELFVVVVAVDPRWLLRSLRRHHEGLFDDNEVAYLDKIFHIPVALRPMGDHAGRYLQSLLPPVEELVPEAVIEQTPQVAPRPAQQAPVADAPAVQAQSVVESPKVVARPTADLNPEGLRLRAAEREFLGRLTPLLPTPRAIKKLVNLYRLLRLGVPENTLDEFVGGDQGGPYQAAALLLAVLVGAPQAARTTLESLAKAAPGQDVVDALPVAPLRELIVALRKDIPVHGDALTYRQWAATVARYGFETYDLFTG